MPKHRKLTKVVHDHLVEAARTGCTLKVACASVSINYGTFCRWIQLGKNPDNKLECQLRDDIKRARAEAEQMALRNIQTAGLDPANWRAAAWFLTNSIRGRYLNSAVKIHKPVTNITLADVAREMEDEAVHSNGQVEVPVEDLSGRSGAFFPSDPGMDDPGSQ